MEADTIVDGIRYELINEHNLESAIECVSHTFIQNEPLAAHLEITVDEFLVFARAFYPSLIEPGISFAAVDVAKDKVVGVRVSEDLYQELEEPPEIPGLSPKFHPLFDLLDKLGHLFADKAHIRAGQYVHMFMIAVEPGYQGKGIAPNMNKVFFRHVIDKGFTHAITEPTGLISQHILANKFGFETLAEITYADYTFEGTKPFADLEEHPSAKLMVKKLSDIKL